MRPVFSALILLALSLGGCATSKGPKGKRVWTLDVPNSAPESAFYHAQSGRVFISHVVGNPGEKDGKGWISVVDLDGKVTVEKWADGLNAPKGMRSQGGNLWVSDIDRILAFDLSTGKKVKDIPVKGAKFLNDVAADDRGNIYVSDMLDNVIYKVDPQAKLSVFAKGTQLECPNGLLAVGGKLFVASWGTITDPATFGTQVPGRLYALDLVSKKQDFITKFPLGNLDGLELDSEGNAVVTDWVNGLVFRIDGQGRSEVLYADIDGAADIALVQERNLLIVPGMNQNKVHALQLPPSPKAVEMEEPAVGPTIEGE